MGDTVIGFVVRNVPNSPKFVVVETKEKGLLSVNRNLCQILKPDNLLVETKDYVLSYNRDTIEGREYHNKGVVRIIAQGLHDQFVEYWCYNRFGSKIGFVEGAFNEAAVIELWAFQEANPHSEQGRFIDTRELEVLVVIDVEKETLKNMSTKMSKSILDNHDNWQVYECRVCGHLFSVEVKAKLAYGNVQCPDLSCDGSGEQLNLKYVEGTFDNMHYI